jgi:hypothetical protein
MNNSMLTNPVLTVIVGLLAIAVLFLPAIVANQKKHKQYNSILLINILFGWTIIGWLIALIWAISASPVQSSPTARQ